MAGNDAEGKAPTIEEEMAKFTSIAFKDGEPSRDTNESQADVRKAAEEAERIAGEVNRRSHAENMVAGKTSTEKPAAGATTEVKLTEDEEEAALQALAKAKGTEDLSQEDMEKAIADALTAKKAAAKPTRQQKKAERYDDNYRARRAMERENADLRRRLDALERGDKAPLTSKTEPATTSELVKPDHTDTKAYQYGELDPKYLADLARYETLKTLADDKVNQGKTSQTAAEAEAVAAFKERVEAFSEAGRDEFEDFDEVVTDTLGLPKDDPAAWPLSAVLGDLILESDHGRAIAYELASDVKEAKRIAKLSDARQAIWFGQKEAELSAGSAASTKIDPKTGKPIAKAAAAAEKPNQQSQVQVRESKAPIPLRAKLNGAGGNRVPSSATTDFAAFEAMTKQKAR